MYFFFIKKRCKLNKQADRQTKNSAEAWQRRGQRTGQRKGQRK